MPNVTWKLVSIGRHYTLKNATAGLVLRNKMEHSKLARINLEAAKYCTETSAFDKAIALFQSGLNAFGVPHRWDDDNFVMAFEIMERLVSEGVACCRRF